MLRGEVSTLIRAYINYRMFRFFCSLLLSFFISFSFIFFVKIYKLQPSVCISVFVVAVVVCSPLLFKYNYLIFYLFFFLNLFISSEKYIFFVKIRLSLFVMCMRVYLEFTFRRMMLFFLSSRFFLVSR